MTAAAGAPRLLVVDNYDSFTFNLVQALEALGARVDVRRNDAVSAADAARIAPDGLVVSPGPGRPEEAGASCSILRAWSGRSPTLGVCLGHQCLAVAFGGRVVRARRVMHGKTSLVRHDGRDLFAGLPDPFEAMRYHSLVVDRARLPGDLDVCAWTDAGEIMGLRVRGRPIWGVQIHPESYRTPAGPALLANFVKACRAYAENRSARASAGRGGVSSPRRIARRRSRERVPA